MKQPTIPTQYWVSVGHIGTVYRGANKEEANKAYYDQWQKHHGSGSTIKLTSRRGSEINTLTNIDPSYLD
jgi:hypothetical protein